MMRTAFAATAICAALAVAFAMRPSSKPPDYFALPVKPSRPTEAILKDARDILEWHRSKEKSAVLAVPFSEFRRVRDDLGSIYLDDPKAAEATLLRTEFDKVADAVFENERQERLREQRAEALRVANDVGGRKAFADEVQKLMLRLSMDAYVETRDAKGATLRVKYILFNRPTIFRLQEDGTIGKLTARMSQLGFTKLTMTNGYDQSWDWTIRP